MRLTRVDVADAILYDGQAARPVSKDRFARHVGRKLQERRMFKKHVLVVRLCKMIALGMSLSRMSCFARPSGPQAQGHKP
jgi:hypothetical protein